MSDNVQTRFPWVYALFSAVPLLLLLALELSSRLLSPQEAMGPMMACSLLIGPSAAIVLAWGIYLLLNGEAKVYPALRWLVIMPVLLAITGMIFS